MKPRKLLFRNGKPKIRPAVYDDIRWLWASARREGFKGTPEEFTAWIEPLLADAHKVFVVEDHNANFQSGFGPVGMAVANYDGWALVPHALFMEWATPRNKLRSVVAFLYWMSRSREVGTIKIFAEAEYAEWFDRLKRYLPIRLSGYIAGGRYTGDECIFYLKGRKDGRSSSTDSGISSGRSSQWNRRQLVSEDAAAAGAGELFAVHVDADSDSKATGDHPVDKHGKVYVQCDTGVRRVSATAGGTGHKNSRRNSRRAAAAVVDRSSPVDAGS